MGVTVTDFSSRRGRAVMLKAFDCLLPLMLTVAACFNFKEKCSHNLGFSDMVVPVTGSPNKLYFH